MSRIEAKLNAVTVYPDRARLTRQGKISLQPGFHWLEVGELSPRLDPNSARVAARGTASARLLGLQVQKVFYHETPTEAVRELEAQLEAAQDEMRALDARISMIEGERSRMADLAGHTEIFATALAAGEMSVEDQLALFDGLRVRVEGLDAEDGELLARKRSLERRIQQLEKRLEQVRGARPRERYTATVELEVTGAGELSLELSYVVSHAGWEPLYDLRLLEEGDGPSLEVGYLAQVRQETGEDWGEVALTLSTARPALAATLPELDPWYIRPLPRVEVRKARVGAGAPSMADAMALQAPAAPPEGVVQEQAEVEPVMAGVDRSGAAVTYQVPGAVAVPADGAPHKVSVARYALLPELDYVTAPKLVQAAYRRAKMTNDSSYTLLPGAVNMFAGEEFIGATRLELTAPGGELELYLGVDDRVKVERELVRREVDKRLVGGKRRVRYGYEIRLENLLPFRAALTIHDQMPVARHEDIKVRREGAQPEPTRESELNLLDWDLYMEAGEKQVVRFDFLVEYPQDMQVGGLP